MYVSWPPASHVFLAHGSGHGLRACRKGLGQVWAEGKKDLPKKSANTVHVMVMTLYGIEKSGVGHWSKTESANSTTSTSSLALTWAGGRERSDAAHPIPSFACPSARGACQHIMDARHSPHTVLHHNAMSGVRGLQQPLLPCLPSIRSRRWRPPSPTRAASIPTVPTPSRVEAA